MKLCVKIGGAQLDEHEARVSFARSVRKALDAGHSVVLVHGGGNQVRRWCKRLDIEQRYVDGLRVTDEATAEVVLAVLGGEVGRTLVQSLAGAGVKAVSLTGADGGCYQAQPHRPRGLDIGRVGTVASVEPALLNHLLAGGYVPVIASVAPLAESSEGSDAAQLFYNINADQAAAPLAAALEVDAMLFLTDVPGVLDLNGNLVPLLDPTGADALHNSGALHGGMLPKLDAAFAAALACPRALTKIASATGDDALLAALSSETGTILCADVRTHTMDSNCG